MIKPRTGSRGCSTFELSVQEFGRTIYTGGFTGFYWYCGSKMMRSERRILLLRFFSQFFLDFCPDFVSISVSISVSIWNSRFKASIVRQRSDRVKSIWCLCAVHWLDVHGGRGRHVQSGDESGMDDDEFTDGCTIYIDVNSVRFFRVVVLNLILDL